MRYLREFERTQYWSPEDLKGLQLRRLKVRLDHAYRHCRFYRDRWDAVGLVPSDIQSLKDLSSLPILTKTDIQQQREAMIADDCPRSQMFLDHTGGSSGAPIAYYQSIDVDLSRKAGTKRHNRWAGYRVGDKIAMVWGAPRDIANQGWKPRLRNLLLDRTLVLDTGHLTEAKVLAFSHRLKRFRPKIIIGYARSLAHVARFMRETGELAYQPESIITSAEVLEDDDRQLIEDVFGCPVFDRYGCREVGVLASECEQHQGLHTMAEGLIIEVVNGGKPAAPGETGKLLVTDLLNFAMPLIRYEIGDMAAFDAHPCPCGRGLPRLRQIAGRVTDFVVGSDGRLVSGVFLATYVVAKRPALGQVQITQDTPGELVYRIATLDGVRPAAADLEYLRNTTREHVGPDTNVEFEEVEQLLPEASGKNIFCRSTVASNATVDTNTEASEG